MPIFRAGEVDGKEEGGLDLRMVCSGYGGRRVLPGEVVLDSWRLRLVVGLTLVEEEEEVEDEDAAGAGGADGMAKSKR